VLQADGGGPLVKRESDGIYNLVGIMSFGIETACQRGRPLVFTKVGSYMSWIQANTNIKFLDL
jgi:secreted trypsin-like serine protease